MADIPESRGCKILSLVDGNPAASVGLERPAFQFVRFNREVQRWTIRKAEDDTYLLSVDGYPYVGVLDGKVVASINPEHEQKWTLARQQLQEAFTIVLANESHMGWTIQDESVVEGSEIEIKPIIATHSFPPRFLPTQLFKLEFDGEE